MDFAKARRLMLEGQVRTSDVTNLDLQAAMLEVPRERFVPPDRQPLAYLDRDIDVRSPGAAGAVRCILKPAVLAKLLQAAEIEPANHVLDVGCATGYSSALVSRLASTVVALEEDAALAATARELLASLGCKNVTVVNGPLTGGAPGQAPFDAILLNGSTEVVPTALLRQLRDGGRLVCILGRFPIGTATVFRQDGSHATQQSLFEAGAPMLPGFAKPPEFVF
jgi:protein-L-isoaspartate(D-aspartate) O-methyltransferase